MAQVQYFHELNGLEDSTGSTHLFYRLFETVTFPCNGESGGTSLTSRYNNVFHHDVTTAQDSIIFPDYYIPWCLSGISNSERVNDYDFYENDPTKWVIQVIPNGCFPYPITDYFRRNLALPFICLTKQVSLKPIELDPESGFLISNQEDSLYYNGRSEGGGFRVAIKDEYLPDLTVENEADYAFYNNYMSEVATEFGIAAIHPTIDSLFYTLNSTKQLLLSERYSSAFEVVDTNSSYNLLAFDADSSIIYAIVTTNLESSSQKVLKKSVNFGRLSSWEFIGLPENLSQIEYLATDSQNKGSLYIADSTYIFHSQDYGTSFQFLVEMPSQITGLYKKPASDLLYILTKNELFQFQNGELISLKKLPVSNEEISTDVPLSITLHQNYPNPFNPSTIISYAIPRSGNVQLVIYNSIGSIVRSYENQFLHAGQYSQFINFDGLSSGMYFYRLSFTYSGETEFLSKKMLFIK